MGKISLDTGIGFCFVVFVYLEIIAGLGAIFPCSVPVLPPASQAAFGAHVRVLLSAEQLEAFQASGTLFSTNCVTHSPCPLQQLLRVKTLQ